MSEMTSPPFLRRREFVRRFGGGLALISGFTSSRVSRAAGTAEGGEAVDIGSRLEPFWDRFLVERLEGAALKLHEAHPAGVALRFDRAWEGPFCGYITVLRDGDRLRMYYRGLPKAGRDGSEVETTCYAESADGIAWTKPTLGVHALGGNRDNNVILAGNAPFSHNFSPFLDTRPGLAADQRFKALAGTQASGLVAFASADGLRWRKLRDEPVFRQGALDSQNVAFWSESERRYVLYYRTWTGGGFEGYRTISRATSADFLTWDRGEPMTFGGTPTEHLYTNQTQPYFRAPHIYVALPMRFLPGRQVLTAEEARRLGVDSGYGSDCAEAVFMTSRGETSYDRTFLEGFIRPGPDLGNWASRAGLTALGVVPTGPAEMSVYKQAHYAQSDCHLLRYVLRTDGFASVNAPFGGGEMVTRPLLFTGRVLVLNVSTGAAGGVRVEIQDAGVRALPGFTLAESVETVGDAIERVVRWKGGANVDALAGRPVRLRFVMKDADLYALRFQG